ncbi:MAG: PEGA domain-containing protein [Myxococcota bacterium]
MCRSPSIGRGSRPLCAVALAALLACASAPPEAPANPAASVVVRSNVYGDLLSIDDQVMGPTGPTAHTLAPGRHAVVVDKAGHSRWKTVIDLEPGESRTLRAVLEPLETAAAERPASGATWSDTVAFVRDKLRDRWESGDPPADFDVSDEGVMAFRLRNPADPSVWHHYTVDVRNLAVSPDDLAPSVVSLECRSTPCIHQETCHDGECVGGRPVARQSWFLSDEVDGEKVARALAHLIALALQRPPPTQPVGELF